MKAASNMRIAAVIAVIAVIATSALASQTKPCKGAPKYRIGGKARTAPAPGNLHLDVAIEPQFFNVSSVRLLACRIRHDFPHEAAIQVGIFDDLRTAKHFSPVGPTLAKDSRHLRGFYFMDRKTGEQYITVIPDANDRKSEIKVDMTGEPAD